MCAACLSVQQLNNILNKNIQPHTITQFCYHIHFFFQNDRIVKKKYINLMLILLHIYFYILCGIKNCMNIVYTRTQYIRGDASLQKHTDNHF